MRRDRSDADTAILRDYITAVVDFGNLTRRQTRPDTALICMRDPNSEPQARNLLNIVGYLQKKTGVELHVTLKQKCLFVAKSPTHSA